MQIGTKKGYVMVILQLCSVCTYIVFLGGIKLVPIAFLSCINLLVLILFSIDLIVELNQCAKVQETENN